MASESESRSTEPRLGANPFNKHEGCEHGPVQYAIYPLLDRRGLDLLKFLALVDEELSKGEIKSAREALWGLGVLLDMVQTGNVDLARRAFDVAFPDGGRIV